MSYRSQQQGVTLVELMISLGIFSILTVGMIGMFTSNQESSRLLTGQGTLAESGRFAMELLALSLIHI